MPLAEFVPSNCHLFKDRSTLDLDTANTWGCTCVLQRVPNHSVMKPGAPPQVGEFERFDVRPEIILLRTAWDLMVGRSVRAGRNHFQLYVLASPSGWERSGNPETLMISILF